jgi:hypothetical protein
VINWKELAGDKEAVELAGQVDRAIAAAPAAGDLPVWADGPNAELPEPQDYETQEGEEPDPHTLSLWPERRASDEEPDSATLPPDAGLADRLGHARAIAEQARSADQRSRAALYRALGHAYDFALAAEADPQDYAELLADAGLKRQARAPMTPIVKLVFGAAYDKTRLTEFAAALSWARRNDLGAGNLAAALEGFAGGLKGIVADERAARRPAAKPDREAARRQGLAAAPAIAMLSGVNVGGDTPAGTFVLLVARSEGDGRVSIIAPALRDERLIAGAIAKAAP